MMRSLKRTLIPLLIVVLLLITAPRLPAPISEEATPTPTPKREASPRPKPKSEATTKAKVTPALRFAGTWTGNVISKAITGASGSYSYVIKISDDEKTVLIEHAKIGKVMSGPPISVSCSRFGEALTWSVVSSQETATFTLRLNANGTANYVGEGRWTAGDNAGITNIATGTLSRQ